MAESLMSDPLVGLQVCLGGEISKGSVMCGLSRGKRASGDLIPWTIAQQFADHEFAGLSGARVVRVATHPDFQGLGYGSRALQLLLWYYQGEVHCLNEADSSPTDPAQDILVLPGLLEEAIAPRSRLPPLLASLSEGRAEQLDYVGVAYSLTEQLHRFWHRAGFRPVYLRQTANELTGEHSCIMLRTLGAETSAQWLTEYYEDFRCRFLSLLSYTFRSLPPSLALALLHQATPPPAAPLSGAGLGRATPLSGAGLWEVLSRHDLWRLHLYTRNMADHHLITDLLPTLASLFFKRKVSLIFTAVQSALLLGMGLQHKTVEQLERELGLPAGQLLGLYSRAMRKFSKLFTTLEEEAIEVPAVVTLDDSEMKPIQESVDAELSAAVKEYERGQAEQREALEVDALGQFAVGGKEEEWEGALGGAAQPGIVSISRAKRQKVSPAEPQGKKATGRRKKPHRR